MKQDHTHPLSEVQSTESERQAPSVERQYVAEALEARILYSGSPADLPQADTSDATSENTTVVRDNHQFDSIDSISSDGVAVPSGHTDIWANESVILSSLSNLTEVELEKLADAAVARWAASGLSDEQLAALEDIEISIVDLEGNYVGAAEGFSIYLDWNAAGQDWFIDETPFDDAEFEYAESSTVLRDQDGPAQFGVDVISVMAHEMGHVLGLEDIYESTRSGNLMYSTFDEGERRLPSSGQAVGAVAGSLQGLHYADVTVSADGGTVNDTTAGGVSYNSGAFSFVNNTAGTSLGNGNFNAVAVSGGTGSGMLVDVAISGGTATVTLDTLGFDYVTGDMVTIDGSLIGGVSVTDDITLEVDNVPDILVFNGGTGGAITFDGTGSSIVVAGLQFSTDGHDPSGPDTIIIEGGGQFAILEDGNNDHIEPTTSSNIVFGTLSTGQTGYIINEDNNDLIRFRGSVDIQGNHIVITSGEGFFEADGVTAFDTSDSDEDIRFESTSQLIGTGTINVTGDANVRLNADNSSTFSGDWTVTGGQGSPRIFVNTNGALGTGSVLLDNVGAEIRIANGVDVSNTVTLGNTSNDKTLRWDGLATQTHSGDIITLETASNRANLHVTNTSNTVTVTGLLRAGTNNAWFEKTGAGTLILTNTNNSAGANLDRIRISDGTVIFAAQGTQANNQLMVSGDGRLLIGDGVTITTITRVVVNDNAKVIGLQDGATSATWNGRIDHEVVAGGTNRSLDLYAGEGGTLTINGQIRHDAGTSALADVRKIGDGTVVLTATNNNYGDGSTTPGSNTIVSEGTLRVTAGSNNLPVNTTLTVNSGAFFGGSGDITSFVGAGSFQAGSGILVDVDSSGTPLLTIGAAPVDVTGLNLSVNMLNIPGDSNPVTILSNVTGPFANVANGGTLIVDGNQYTVTYSGTDVQLALVGAVTPETDVRVVGGNLIIEDVNGGTTDDNISLSIVGSNYVIQSASASNVMESTGGGSLVGSNKVTVPVASVTGGIQFLSAGGTDTLTINSALNLNGDLDVQSANVIATEAFNVDTSSANGNITIGGSLIVQGGSEDISISAGSGDITIAGDGSTASDFNVFRHDGSGTVTINSDINTIGGVVFDGVVNAAGHPFIINGTILDGGNITIRNDAFVTFTADNSGFTGNITIDAVGDESRLTVTHIDGLGASGRVTLSGTNARLTIDADGTVSKDITMNNTENQKLLEINAGHDVTLTGRIDLNESSSSGTRNQFFVRADAILTIAGTLEADAAGFQVQGGSSTSRVIITNGNANNTGAGMINIDTGTIVLRDSAAIGTAFIRLNNSETAVELGNGVVLPNDITLTNRNSNKYLRIEDGATSATLGGTITLEGNTAAENQIDLGAGQTLTLTGTITGAPTALLVSGEGTTVMDAGATTDFSGILDIDGGTVTLNSTLSNATVEIATGAALEGTGTITNTIGSVGGSLRAGDGSTTGTLTANGAVTLDSNSTVDVLITGTTTADQIVSNTSIDLAGSTLNVTVDPAFTPAGGETYTIIGGAGAVSNQFSAGTGNFFSGGYEFSVAYNANDVVLTLVGVASTEIEVNLDGSGNLTVTDLGIGADSADVITVTEDGTHYFFTLSGGGAINQGTDATDGTTNAVEQTSPDVVRVLKTAVTGNFTIQTAFTGDEGTDSNNDDVVNLNMDPNVAGDITITADTVNLNSSVTSTGGNITLNGTTFVTTGDVTLSAADVQLNGNSDIADDALTINVTGTGGGQVGRITGTGGSFVKTGTGTWNLQANADPGNTVATYDVQQGTLKVEGAGGNNRAIDISNAQVTVRSGASFDLNTANTINDLVYFDLEAGATFNANAGDLIGGISGAGTIVVNGITLQFRQEVNDLTFTGSIEGSGVLAMYGRYGGQDPWILNESQNGTFTGDIRIGNYSGDNGSNSSVPAVYFNGTTDTNRVDMRTQRENNGGRGIYTPLIGGTGTIAGNVESDILGTIRPGQDGLGTATTGTLTVNGNVTFGQPTTDGAIVFTVDGNGKINGITVGSVNPSSILGTNPATHLEFRIDAANDTSDTLVVNGDLDISNTDLALFDMSGAALAAADDAIYTLITYTGTLTGNFIETINLPAGYRIDTGIPGQINLVGAPEPAASNAFSPADDATGVDIFANLVLTMNQTVQEGTGNILIKRADNSTFATIDITDTSQVTFDGHVITINPTADLEPNTGYYVEIQSGAITNGLLPSTGISDPTVWNFTTGADPTASFTEDTAVLLSNGTLIIRDISSDSADNLIITDDGTNYTITDGGGLTINSSLVGGAGNGTSSVTVAKASVTNGIQFETGNGTDTVTLNGISVTGGIVSDAENTSLAGTISATGLVNIQGEASLVGTTTLDTSANNEDIRFGANLNGAFDLTLTTGSGSFSVNGAIGNTAALASLTVQDIGSGAVGGTVSVTGTYSMVDTDAVGTLTVTGLFSAGTYNQDIGNVIAENGLTVTNGARVGVSVASRGDARADAALTVTGGDVNIGSGTDNFSVGASSGAFTNNTTVGQAIGTVDFQNADSVTVTTTNILLGNIASNGAVGTEGTLRLSDTTNTITTNLVRINYAPSNGSSSDSEIIFGAGTNTVNTNRFSVAERKVIGGRASIASGGTLTLGGRDQAEADLQVGNNGISTGANSAGFFDMTGGTFNATLDELLIGRHGTGNGSGKGTFTMDAGTVTVNTVVLANPSVSGTSANPTNTQGTLNLAGGNMFVGNLSQGNGVAAFNWTGGTIANLSGQNFVNSNVTIDVNTVTALTLDIEAGQSADFQVGAGINFTSGLVNFDLEVDGTGAGSNGSVTFADAFNLTNANLTVTDGTLLADDASYTLVTSSALSGAFNAVSNVATNAAGYAVNIGTTVANGATLDLEAPDINLQGNSLTIVSGDNTPDAADHTDFGATQTDSGSVVRTFTIQNTSGFGPLDLTGTPLVNITGTGAAAYSVTTPPGDPVAASNQTTFQITFTPTTATGGSIAYDATVTIASDDPDEGSYTFDITGQGSVIAGNPDSTVAVVNGVVTFTDIAGDNTDDDAIVVSQSGNILTITSSPGNATSIQALAGITQSGPNAVTVDLSTITGGFQGLVFNTGGGTDSVTTSGNLTLTNADLTFSGVETINLGGDVDTGTGDQTYSAPVEVTANAILTGGTVIFNDTIDSASSSDLTITASTAVDFNGNVGGNNALGNLDTSGSALTRFGESAPQIVAGARLNWDVHLDDTNNNYWENTINPGGGNRWNFDGTANWNKGAAAHDISASGHNLTNFAGVTEAYDIDFNSSGATMGSFQNELGLSGDNDLSNNDFTLEFVFSTPDLTGTHVLWESGGDTDAALLELNGTNLNFVVKDGGVTTVATLVLNDPADIGRFHQVVASIDLTTDEVRLWLNGGSAQGGSQTVATNGNINDWSQDRNSGLGRENDQGPAPTSGSLSDPAADTFISIVRGYQSKVFTDQEVAQNYLVLTTTAPADVAINTTGNQVFGALELSTDVTLTSGAGSDVTIQGNVNSREQTVSSDLTVSAGNNALFQGDVGNSSRITNLTTDATTGTVTFEGNAVQTNQLQTHNGTVNTTSATVFNGSQLVFDGGVFSGETTITAERDGGDITFNADATFNGNVSLFSDDSLFTQGVSLSAGSTGNFVGEVVRFSGALSGTTSDIEIRAGGRNQPNGITEFDSTVNVGSLQVFGSRTEITGNVTLNDASGENYIANQVILKGDVQVTTEGNLNFLSTIDSDTTPRSLQVTANGSSHVTFGGDIGGDRLGATSGDVGLTSFTTLGPGTVSFAKSGATVGINSNETPYLNYVAGEGLNTGAAWRDLTGIVNNGNFTMTGSPVAVTGSDINGIQNAFTGTGTALSLQDYNVDSYRAYIDHDLTNEDTSFEIWVRPSDYTGRHVIWETGANNSAGSSIVLDDDTIHFSVRESGANGGFISHTVPPGDQGDFIQIVGVYDRDGGGGIAPTNNQIKLYVNGQPVTGSPVTGLDLDDYSNGDDQGLGTVNGSLGGFSNTAGNNPAGALAADFSNDFEGEIALFRVWREPLTDVEVLTRYNYVVNPLAIEVSGEVSVSNDVTLGSDLTVTSSGAGNVSLNGTVDGAHDLVINTGGATTLGGAVGAGTALTSLTTDASGTVSIGGNVSTTTTQTFNETVTITTSASLSGTNISFLEGLDVVAAGTGTLTVTGNLDVDGAVDIDLSGTVGASNDSTDLIAVTGNADLSGSTVSFAASGLDDTEITFVTASGTLTAPTTPPTPPTGYDYDATDPNALKLTLANAAPVITADGANPIGNQTINEDALDLVATPLTFSISDSDNAVNTLVVTASSNNQALVPDANLILGGTGSSRTLTVAPAADANGTVTITVSVSDGINSPTTSTFDVTVNAVDDGPNFAITGDIVVVEDNGDQTNDPDSPYTFNGHVTFTDGGGSGSFIEPHTLAGYSVIRVTNTAIFTGGGQPAVDGSGNLTFTTVSNASGFADVTVQATDTGSASAPNENTSERTFRITVTPVNDDPTFNLGSSDGSTDTSDSPFAQSVLQSFVETGNPNATTLIIDTLPGSTYGTLRLADGTLVTVGMEIPVDELGNLIFEPNTSGGSTWNSTLQFQYHLRNADGTETATVIYSQRSAQSAPLRSDSIVVDQDAGAITIDNFARINAGDFDPSSLSFQVTSGLPGLFSEGPRLGLDGTLSFTTAPGAFGTSVVTFELTDGNRSFGAGSIRVTLNPITPSTQVGGSGSSQDFSPVVTRSLVFDLFGRDNQFGLSGGSNGGGSFLLVFSGSGAPVDPELALQSLIGGGFGIPQNNGSILIFTDPTDFQRTLKNIVEGNSGLTIRIFDLDQLGNPDAWVPEGSREAPEEMDLPEAGNAPGEEGDSNTDQSQEVDQPLILPEGEEQEEAEAGEEQETI